jgi:hypothetical protein
MPKCATCRHISLDPEGGHSCRHSPPQVTIIMVPKQNALGQITPQMSQIAAWPAVKVDGFCSQWAPKGMVLDA